MTEANTQPNKTTMKKNTKIVDPENYPYNDDPFIIQNKKAPSKKPCSNKEETALVIKWDHEVQEAVLRLEARIISLQWIASCSIGLSALTVLFVGLHK
jgi:hypothetical protein